MSSFKLTKPFFALVVFWLLLIIPYFKKFFIATPIVISIFSIVSVLLLTTVRFNRPSIFYIGCVFIFFLFNIKDISYIYMIAGAWPFLMSNFFKVNYKAKELAFNNILLALVMGFAVWQILFGYSQVEIDWFNSGIGGARAGYLAFEGIRPMSLLSGAPELAFLLAGFSFYFLFKNNHFLFFICFIAVMMVAVRGIIIGYFLSIIFHLINKYVSKIKLSRIYFPLLITPFIYLFIYFLSEFFANISGNFGRISVFGTFSARADIVIEFFQKISFEQLMLGVHTSNFVYDNYWLTILDKLGFIGVYMYIYMLSKVPRDEVVDLLFVLYLSYSFFADVGYFFYFSLIIVLFSSIGLITNYYPQKACKIDES